MTPPVALGVIGCGRVTERYYVPAFSQLREVRVAAVADRSDARRRLIADHFPGCRAFDSADALLDEAAVQGIVIATPPETHLDIARLALRRGLAVLIEKPLARSDALANGLPSLEPLAERRVMLGFNRRYWDAVRRLREALRAHHATSEICARLAIAGNPRAWGAVSDASDALDDQGSHHLDLLRHLFDRDVLAVSAQWTDPQAIAMRVRLAGGIVAECAAAHHDRPGESIAVDCGGKQYRISRGSERAQPASGRRRAALDAMDTWRRRLLGRRSSLRRSYEEQLRQFARGIRLGTALEPGFADGLAVLRIAQAARRSAAQGGAEVRV
jgi:predicted dehydrogenase